MSVTVRPYQGGPEWEVDIRTEFADGTPLRMRVKAPVSLKADAVRWGRAREREILLRGPKQAEQAEKEVVPTLKEFAPRYLEGHAEANRLKPSGIASKKTILNIHLIPELGNTPLDQIGDEEVQHLKSKLRDREPKTVNNILSVLNTMLRVAVEWKVIQVMPCRIRQLRVARSERPFHDFGDYEQLVSAAKAICPEAYVIVLLGGDAGLRCGEIMALEWTDIDLKRDPAHLVVNRSEWRGRVTVPKGGRSRRVPLTSRLAEALKSHRHMKGKRVLCRPDGSGLTQKMVQVLVRKVARKANLKEGGVHTLRHTFCSHLAMRGATVRAIQLLAGHQDISTTQIYMHLSPAALEDAIALLESPKNPAAVEK